MGLNIKNEDTVALVRQVDTSAIVAIVLEEPGAGQLVEILLSATDVTGEPLRYVGDAFTHTDIIAAHQP